MSLDPQRPATPGLLALSALAGTIKGLMSMIPEDLRPAVERDSNRALRDVSEELEAGEENAAALKLVREEQAAAGKAAAAKAAKPPKKQGPTA